MPTDRLVNYLIILKYNYNNVIITNYFLKVCKNSIYM